jgi:hypothetical protein
MGQTFKETAHLKTDLKKFQENWELIDWTKKAEESVKNDTENQKDTTTVAKSECDE